MDLMEMLTRQLGQDGIRQVSDRVGADSDATAKVISAALPVLVGALAKNSASADGASDSSAACSAASARTAAR